MSAFDGHVKARAVVHSRQMGGVRVIERPPALFLFAALLAAVLSFPLQAYAASVVDISQAVVTNVDGAYEYDGACPVQPDPVVEYAGVTLEEGVDYEVSYGAGNDVPGGTGSLTVSGIGAFDGEVPIQFAITSRAAGLFDDVGDDPSAYDWYVASGVFDYANVYNLMTGYSGTDRFGPYDQITRGQVAVVLHRMEGEPAADADDFDDVDYSQYYGNAIEWARATGVIHGYQGEDGAYCEFRPEQSVTREELAVMLANYAAYKMGVSSVESACTALDAMPDAASVASWARVSLGWCMDQGIVNGVSESGGSYLRPGGAAWRASMASMASVLHRDVLDMWETGSVQPGQDSEGRYEIRHGSHLRWFADQVNGGNSAIDAVLVNDIVVQDGVDGSVGASDDLAVWSPIGSRAVSYAGTFDGQGHTVSGIYLCAADKTTASYTFQGLFGRTSSTALVTDVSVDDSYVSACEYSGALVGYNEGLIEGCSSRATIEADYVVAESGASYGNSRYTGGIVGYNAGTVVACVNVGSVALNGYYAGGIAGASVGSVSICVNYGEVDTTASFVGGIVGMAGAEGAAVEACFNYGSVSGGTYLGGIAGSLGTGGSASRCYNGGSVDSSASTGVGGIAGGGSSSSQHEDNCYLRGTCSWGVQSSSASSGMQGVVRVDSAPEAAYLFNEAAGSRIWAATSEKGRIVPATDRAAAPVEVSFVATAGSAAGSVYRCVYSDVQGVVSLAKADPKEENFRFDGLYEDASCTQLFADADASTATVDAETTLYAGMSYVEGLTHEPYADEVENEDTASLPEHEQYATDVTSYEVHTDHYGSWVQQSDGSSIDIQVVEVSLSFDEAVSIVDVDELGAELAVSINSSKATYYASDAQAESDVYADPSSMRYTMGGLSSDGKTLSLTVYIGYAIYAGHLSIEPPASGLTQLVYADGRSGGVVAALRCIVPNGLEAETVEATPATESAAASTTTRFTAVNDEGNHTTRAMVHITVLLNGVPVGNTLNANWATAETHWHDYQNLTVAGYLALCVSGDGTEGWLGSALSDDYILSVDGDELTITARESNPGDVLEVQVSSYLNNGSLPLDTTALSAAVDAGYEALSAYAGDSGGAVAGLESAVALGAASLASPYYSQSVVDAKAEAIYAAIAALS